jgi:hypothetical protein
VRVGIATGLVVVGDLIGAGAAQGQAVVGETPDRGFACCSKHWKIQQLRQLSA